MRFLVIFLFPVLVGAQSFTEFYVQTTGSNLNAGSDSTNTAAVTYASGNWVQGTGVFTVASGNPSSDGVAAGHWASVYPDGSTTTPFVGRVTAADSTTITVSLTAKSGTAPTDGTGNRTLKIGGAWDGPDTTVAFPFGFVQSTMVNSSSDAPRINIKSGTTYSITAAMTHGNNGPIVWQGYTTAVGDGGLATISGPSSGASFTLLTASCANNLFADLIFTQNGDSGTSDGVNTSGTENIWRRCVFSSFRGTGLAGNDSLVVECEARGNNESNTANKGGFVLATGGGMMLRCYAEVNTGSASTGFRSSGSGTFINCISAGNGSHGFAVTGNGINHFIGCDSYNNTGSGLDHSGTTAAMIYIENCNFIDNGAWGISAGTADIRIGYIINCGFGAGTAANASGTIQASDFLIQTGNITYADDAVPWVDAANDDFRINLTAAKQVGRGTFFVNSGSTTNTVSFPDIGAAQSYNSGGGGEKSYLFVK